MKSIKIFKCAIHPTPKGVGFPHLYCKALDCMLKYPTSSLVILLLNTRHVTESPFLLAFKASLLRNSLNASG